MHIPAGDADKCWNVAVQVQQGVHLDGGLAPTKLRHGNSDRHRSMVVESRAYRLCSRSTPIGSRAYSGRAMAIKTCAKSAKILQSCDSFASASVERATLPRNPRWYSLPCTERRQASMSRKLPDRSVARRPWPDTDPSRKIRAAGCRLIALDATAKLPVGKEADQLRKDGAALIHEPLSAVPAAQTSPSDVSNRGKLETDSTHYRPVTCCRLTLL